MQRTVAYATSECRKSNKFSRKSDFSQKEPDEKFPIDKTLIHARVDFTKLKRILE